MVGTRLDTWLNFDASPTLRFERVPLVGRVYRKNAEPFPANVRVGDIVAGLPIEAGSCQLLYCSHVLEHLSLDDCVVAIRNSFDLLRPGGVWRIVLPDLRYEAEAYLQDGRPHASERFMEQTGLGLRQRPRRVVSRLFRAFGNSGHLWMWDYPSLEARLSAAGFRDIRRAEFGDSDEPAFREVERAERWDHALGVECRRPLPGGASGFPVE